jgi:hypothetical protein
MHEHYTLSPNLATMQHEENILGMFMNKITALRQHQVVVRQRAAAVDALLVGARRPLFLHQMENTRCVRFWYVVKAPRTTAMRALSCSMFDTTRTQSPIVGPGG